MTPKTITRTTRLHVAPEGEPIFSERSFMVEIDDDGGGEFVTVTDMSDRGGKIHIDRNEWPALRDAIDQMIAGCRVDA